jgi:hypothetical protein
VGAKDDLRVGRLERLGRDRFRLSGEREAAANR